MKLFTGFLFVFISQICFSQSLVVKDIETNLPLEFVVFQSFSGTINELSNARGQVVLNASEKDTFRISILGYYTQNVPYSILESQKTIYLKADRISLDNVVIVGNKWEQPEREFSQTHIEISAADIEMGNPQNSADLLGQTGAVFIQKSQQGGGSPIIRGFATNRVLISVDEVRMNNAIFRSGNLQNVISIDPLSIERTEVLFGPGSLLHGSDAVGGVMGFYTLKPEFTKDSALLIKTNAMLRKASANQEQSQHYDVKIGGNKWAFVCSISLNDFGNLRMGSNGPDEYLRTFSVERKNGKDVGVPNPNPLIQLNTAYSQLNLMQKLAFKPNNKLELTYAIHHSKTSPFDRYDRLLRTRDGEPRSAQWYYGPQIWTMHHFKTDYEAQNILFDNMQFNLAYQHFEESRIDRDFGSETINRKTELVDAYTLSLDFSKKLKEQLILLYGIDGAFNNVYSKGSFAHLGKDTLLPGPSRYPNSTWFSSGIYATLRNRISEKTHTEFGLRYTRFLLNSEFDSTFYSLPFSSAKLNQGALTWSVGLVYDPIKNLKLSANISTGFRLPNVDDIGKIFDSEPGAVVVPNPSLKAENAYSFDLGLGYIFKKNVRLDASVYYTYLNNAMVRRDYTLNGADSILYSGELSKVQAVQNAAQATVYGFQIGIEAKINNAFSFSTRFSYQDGIEVLENGTKDRPRHTAPWFGISSLNYSYKKLLLSAYSQYNGGFSAENLPLGEAAKDYLYAMDENDIPYLPAWITYNFRLRYRLGDYISFSGGIENLLDLRYRPYSSGLTAPGRNFHLAAKISF